MAPLTKPEALLKQAEGLISVSQPSSALQTLTEFLFSRKFRTTPLAQLEPIMIKFVDLCVDLRRGRSAKEGLMQFKNVAQNVNVASVEVVVRRFVSGADKKVREAKEKARLVDEKARPNASDVDVEGNVNVDVDDLEASETPESILLGAVSSDQSKDRTDRALVTPWLKFLWEAYRTALETLKNNSRLEAIYQQIAQQAFQFCITHQRKTEFRRLCETLRLHLSSATKLLAPPTSTTPAPTLNPHAIDLRDAEVLGRHLETRFAQLSASVKLELWQEAFRSVEDVHGLLVLSPNGLNALKDSPALTSAGTTAPEVNKDAKVDGKVDGKTDAPVTTGKSKTSTKQTHSSGQSMLAEYYLQLGRIFLTGQNTLFHATALSRYFSIIHPSTSTSTSTSGKSEEEIKELAGLVLLSALAVPVSKETSGVLDTYDSDALYGSNADSGEKEGRGRNARLVTLLGLGRMPTRRGLLRDALSKNIYTLAPESVRNLYDAMETGFDPLDVVEKVVPLFRDLYSSKMPATSDTQDSEVNKDSTKESVKSLYPAYTPLLISALLARLMNQLSQVYSEMKVENLVEMVKPLAMIAREYESITSQVSSGETVEKEKKEIDAEGFLEQFITQTARRGDLNIKINHAKAIVKFIDEPYALSGFGSAVPPPSLPSPFDIPSLNTPANVLSDTPVQASVHDIVRTRLSTLATTLHNALFRISPPTPPTPEEQAEKFATLVKAANAERSQLQLLLSLTSRRRDLSAELTLRREKEEAVRRLEMAKKEKEEEAKRLLEETKKKDKERIKREMEAIRREESRKVRENMGMSATGKSIVGVGGLADDKEELTTDELMLLQVQQLEKEKKELAERLRIISKRMDHTERAYRKEERPLLEADYEVQKQNDYAAYLALQELKKAEALKRHTEGLKSKERLSRIVKDGTFDEWRKIFEKKRGEEFEKRRSEALRKMEEEKAKRKAKTLKQREEERRRLEELEREKREQEEEERRKEEESRAEEERRAAEEAARIAEEEAKKMEEEERLRAQRAQREKERAEAAEKARLQAQREEEAMRNREARKKAEREAASTGASAPVARESAWRRSAATSSTPTPAGSTPPTPSKSASAAGPDTSGPPSPAPVPRSKYGPLAQRAAGTGNGSSWRDREAAKNAAPSSGPTSGAASPRRPASPAVVNQPAKESEGDDGFTTVQPKKWTGSRLKLQKEQQQRP